MSTRGRHRERARGRGRRRSPEAGTHVSATLTPGEGLQPGELFTPEGPALTHLPTGLRQSAVSRIGLLQGNRHLQRLLNARGQPLLQARRDPDNVAEPELADAKAEGGLGAGKHDASFRFGGDTKLEAVTSGARQVKRGSSGMTVIKMQQALVDMGYPLPKWSVDGKFGPETQAALKKFQFDAKIPETGEFDQATIAKMQERFDTRQPYIDNATFDPAHPDQGTRALSAQEKAAVLKAMVPARGTGGKASTFQEDVGGQKYGDAIRDRLDKLIKHFHKTLYADKEPLRADPAKNFHAWNVLEGTAGASKQVTDALYSSYATGPKMTHAAGNFVDQWEDEKTRNAALKPDEQKEKARGKVNYLIVSNCTGINKHHSAVPSDPKEKAILDPIVESFVDTPAKVQSILEIEMGWEGAQLEGVVYLQRYKQDTDDANRAQLWELFHTCIHEYLHSLTHPKLHAYAEKFRAKGDETRYNTLTEGMNDFFTENVRKTVKIDDALRQKVEGPYYNAKAPVPSVSPDVYPSIAQAEQVVAIVGIRNAQAAYFQGRVELIGGK